MWNATYRGRTIMLVIYNLFQTVGYYGFSSWVPTLLISGEADLASPPGLIRMVAAQIPSAELVTVPEAGHSTYWERPDIFNRAVLDFIGRHSK